MNDATTDREIYCDGKTYAEHCAWIDSLGPDETLILHAPNGWRYTLVIISDLKRMLASTIPTEHRLRFLEFLDNHSNDWPPEIIASIAPMCDAGAEIMSEAHKLGDKMLDKIAEWDVFSTFCALNPSLLEALRMRGSMRVYPHPDGYSDQANRSN
jgi:hypothetical protein